MNYHLLSARAAFFPSFFQGGEILRSKMGWFARCLVRNHPLVGSRCFFPLLFFKEGKFCAAKWGGSPGVWFATTLLSARAAFFPSFFQGGEILRSKMGWFARCLVRNHPLVGSRRQGPSLEEKKGKLDPCSFITLMNGERGCLELF